MYFIVFPVFHPKAVDQQSVIEGGHFEQLQLLHSTHFKCVRIIALMNYMNLVKLILLALWLTGNRQMWGPDHFWIAPPGEQKGQRLQAVHQVQPGLCIEVKLKNLLQMPTYPQSVR